MSKFPVWLRNELPDKKVPVYMVSLLQELNLNTVCQSARCPNIGKCFSNKRATFMILGNICTRNCTFCAIKKGIPQKIDKNEPLNIAHACIKLGIRHAVVTSVTRDDLPLGGAEQFAQVIKEIKKFNNKIIIEVLTPDFSGNIESLDIIASNEPNIFNHNIETVQSLYPKIRPMANYKQSLDVLKKIKEIKPDIFTKSGIMVGLGEKKEEVYEVMRNLRKINCDILTIGQYLQPAFDNFPVNEYIPPEVFADYKIKAQELGFKYVASAPLVRSSFEAEEFSWEAGLLS
ncbi:MAG: lipoyl synthase [Candidatus Firestonebacteria bacterium]|nr:lipoyl synthase [Candidatus Firestonebacteria bacterium]